jgi:zinc ribbon protein
MFCPKCATNNLDGASFCRGCGANISLVSQALTGEMEPPPAMSRHERRRRRREGREATLDHAFKNIFMGIAFFIVAIALSRMPFGQMWWFWMFLPAFSLMGTGIAQFIRLREKEKHASLAAPPVQRSITEAQNTNVLMPPAPSVTEGTTRHLNANERK